MLRVNNNITTTITEELINDIGKIIKYKQHTISNTIIWEES